METDGDLNPLELYGEQKDTKKRKKINLKNMSISKRYWNRDPKEE